MAEISVVVPVYNVEKYICRCLDSIIRQSFQNIEIIVVDDGSTDRSGVICDEYQMKDARIHVIHQANRGLSGARNTGIEWIINNSPSRWLCFIDSDDWINTVYFEELYNVANKYKCMISACDFYTVTEDTESVNTGHIYEGMISVEELYNRHFYVAQSACAKLFDISLFSQCNLRFRENVLYEDSDIIYQVLFSQSNIAFTNKSVYFYFQNLESITSSYWTPEKMIYCEIMDNQLNWLVQNGHQNCAKTCVLHFLNNVNYQERLIRGKSDYSTHIKRLRKTCRRLIQKYARKYEITLSEYPQLYEAGYPHFMNIYWFLKAQIDRIIGNKKNTT